MGNPLISEAQDNYRKPEQVNDEQLLFNYFDQSQTDLIKKRLY